MKIKKKDIFKVYEEGKETQIAIAISDSINPCGIELVDCRPIGRMSNGEFTSPVHVEECIESVICNLDELEKIVEKAWMYDDLCE